VKISECGMRILIGAALSFEVVAACSGQADGENDLGAKLAQATLASARAYASEGRRNWLNCEDQIMGEIEMTAVCAAEKSIAESLRGIQQLRGDWGDKGPEYARTAEAKYFHILLNEGIGSENPIVRLHVLTRMFAFCDDGEYMTKDGKARCGEEVESGCLRILEQDSDGLNRQVALEILGMGYASSASESKLGQIASIPNRKGERCIRVFENGSQQGEGTDLDRLAKEYDNKLSPCERELARQALKVLRKK